MTSPDRQTALQAILRAKVHVQKGTLAALPTAEADRLRSPLDLGRRALWPLRRCPAALLWFWAEHPRGHLVIGPRQEGYRPGLQPVGRQPLDGVAWVPARALTAQEVQLPLPVAHLLDHLLGSDGAPEGPWLSEGGGRSPAWQEVGRRLQRQFSLGYAPAEATAEPRAYFAWGLRSFLADPVALNTVDPGLERLLRTTLCSDEFWARSP
ncbi:MAG: hypothetical protein RMN53_09990 [Anaerolineae bacterium]|nr:hypothetical protein [Anaerolineae bacterium]